jgi:predicted DNA-binding transcriptional regulator AlpA
MNNPEDRLLSGREAAFLLHLSERTLERHRAAGTGPRYILLGRAVRYRRLDLTDYIERAARQSTSEVVPVTDPQRRARPSAAHLALE